MSINNELFEIGLKYGTDKVTHYFLHHYDAAFNHLRNEPIRFLEIGVFKGASIRMWREYFPNAEIHCIDINKIDLSDLNGVTMHITDCDNKQALSELSEKLGEFDIVIDDGGHTMRQQQNALEVFWKKTKSGGVFVMEDLHTSIKPYYASYNHENQPTTYELIESLINKDDFSSSYISKESYKEIAKDVGKVNIIWSKKIISNDPVRPWNASITSFINKV